MKTAPVAKRTSQRSFRLEPLESRRLLSVAVLDTTLGINGVAVETAQITPNDMVVQADGKILITDATQLLRFNANGSPDTSFGTDGVITPGFAVGGAAVQSDGKIVVGGAASNGWAAARYNADGSPDTTFGTGGQTITQVSGYQWQQPRLAVVGIQPDGDIILGGTQPVPNSYQPASTDIDMAAVCFNTNGTLNTAFGTGGEATAGTTRVIFQENGVSGMTVNGNGQIDIYGGVNDFGDTNYGTAYVFSASGTLESATNPGGYWGRPTGAAVLPNDDFVYSTYNWTDGEIAQIEFPTATSPFFYDDRLSAMEQNSCAGIAADPDGTLIAAGMDSNGIGLERYNSDGSIDTTFGVNGSLLLKPSLLDSSVGSVNGVAVESNGNFLIDGVTASGKLFLASVRSDAAFAAPAATCDASSVTRTGRYYQFTVQYTAPGSVDATSLGNGNIIVGFARHRTAARLVSYTTYGDTASAIYRVNARALLPRRGSGTLDIRLRPNAVFDDFDNAVPAGVLASFHGIWR